MEFMEAIQTATSPVTERRGSAVLAENPYFNRELSWIEFNCRVLDEALDKAIRERLRTEYTPRHVPDKIFQAPLIPYTISGKRMEVPVRRILSGVPVAKAANRDAMANPGCLDWYVALAARRQQAQHHV